MAHTTFAHPVSRRAFALAAGWGALSVAGALAGCAGGSSEGPQGSVQGVGSAGDGATSQVIVAMNTESEPAAGFDPLVAWGCGEHVHEPLIQSTLITTDEELNFQNDLATSYACSDDGLTWTFTIRDDVVFSDGEPLTASDVAFTINGAVRSTAFEADLSMVDEAVATSDTTVELHLNKPFNALLYTLAVLGIVPEHAYDEGYGEAPIGSGRYLLERWDRGQQVIFVANPSYYGETPQMERVVVVFMDEDAALAAVQAGEVDIAFTFATHAGQSFAGYELVHYATVDSRGISLPVLPAGGTKVVEGDMTYAQGNDVTSDVAVRRAINCAIDRDAMIENVLQGYGKPAFSVSDGMPWSSDDMQVDYDPDRARDLLDEAGWVLGDDGVRERDGVRAALTVWYSSDDSVRQALTYELANQLAKIGIEVTPAGGSWDELYAHQYEDPSCGAGAPTRPSRCMRSITPAAGATMRATRAPRSMLISMPPLPSRGLRTPTPTGSSPHGTARTGLLRAVPPRGHGSPTSTISTSSATDSTWPRRSRTPMGTAGRSSITSTAGAGRRWRAKRERAVPACRREEG